MSSKPQPLHWLTQKGAMPKLARTPMLLVAAMLVSCTSTEPLPPRPLLADLPAFDRSVLDANAEATEQQLDALYQQILTLQPAPQTRQKILYRLSQMHTSQLERQDLPLPEEQAALTALVDRYQQLLTEFPDDPNNELIRYQLARSYDLLGQQQACLTQLDILLQTYPESSFASEVWFRKADIHFSRTEYELALPAFLAVLSGKDTTLKQQARYMAGWSYFKQQDFAKADEQFLQVLDDSYSELLLTEAQQPQQSLREEVMRTLSVSLSYQQQGQSLQQLLLRVPYFSGERPLAMRAELYQSLALFLQEKQLVSESLDTYQRFIADNPDTLTAAQFQLILIKHHLAQGDASAALAEQRHYIELFGPESAFWQRASVTDLAEVQPLLLQYLNYFARDSYATALAAQGDARQRAFAASIPFWQQIQLILQQASPLQPAVDAQGNVYPLSDIRYLLAESYAGSGDDQQALTLYTGLGYNDNVTDASIFTAQDAAYKALLLSEQLANDITDDQQSSAFQQRQLQWWQQQTDFITKHPQHPAAQQVALQQLQLYYAGQDYQAVLSHAALVTDWGQPRADNVVLVSDANLVNEARFLQSQSELALQQYAAAEASIVVLLEQTQTQARKQLLTEQLASSIYQQAQAPGISNQLALQHLQRLLQQLPDSAYHEAAAYQQISLLIAENSWAATPELLNAFIKRYPDSERTVAAKARLIESHEQLQQWDKAAAQLALLSATSSDETQQRETLWLAGQYYLRANDQEAARNAFRDYANRYPQPHALAQEARDQLVQLYRQQNDVYRANYWLAKMASFEQDAADQSTDRTRQLAAQALLALGRHESMLFNAVKLNHPLKTSLKKKRQHMTDAIARYEQSMQYGVAQTLSEAQFQIGSLYEEMAGALLASERPKGMDALALEQYDLLLEEQAYPFEEQAIAIYRQTSNLTQQQVYDDWVKQSFARLALLLPAKFNKAEAYLEVADAAN